MHISVSVVASDVQVAQDFLTLEVLPDMTVESLKSFVQDEIRVQPSAQLFLHNQQPITNTSQTLSALGISEGDMLGLVVRTNANAEREQGQAQRGGQSTSAVPDSETLRLQVLGDARLMAEIRNKEPELAAAVNNPQEWQRIWNQKQQANADAQREKERAMAALDADPFNAEAQAKIEEIIRQERVMENMQRAMDENPESFGRVVMLYIDVLVNNTPIKAFVDSGAQTTIMSPEAAERCGIMRLIDRRFGGIARGVGTAKILGRVHSADIQIGQYSLASSFTVMEGKGVDLLLGLDMLRRHQMCIDLKDSCLRVHSDTIPFLSENEIPRGMEEAMEDEPKMAGPGGTQIGTTTGTVEPRPGAVPSSAAGPSSSAPAGASRITIHPSGSPGNVLTSPPVPPPSQIPAASAASGAAASNLPPGITEQAVATITELGFPRQEAVMALQQANGNVELAISLLL